MAVVCFSFLPLTPEYKKKYGEEHGSCQAGIAGFFTEVGISCVGISLLLLVFIVLLSTILVTRGSETSGGSHVMEGAHGGGTFGQSPLGIGRWAGDLQRST